ncbi:MAG: TrkA family potassium uptake protein [Provencibacterium sp.]|jgi:trk system potassium uptake protein TrkA|nr:TrkA family potassium uptake protein [Provencibacterium sp.]
MNVLIVGCGKVGSHLANYLDSLGHDVSIVDMDAGSFDQLEDDFSGYTVQGVPIDQEVLRRAGILGCDAVAALSQDDNVNIMVSQLAREVFHVPKVITRIYDPKRKDVFSHFGLKTVCPTDLTVDAVYSMLIDIDDVKRLTFDASVLGFYTIPAPRLTVGDSIKDLRVPEGQTLLGVLHANGSITLYSREELRRVIASDRIVYAKLID